MKRRYRLRGGRAFAAVREAGAEGRSGPVRVQLRRREDESVRVGLVVPARVGGAVVRNRLRRRLRHLLAARLGELRGLDVVVACAAGADALAWGELGRHLDVALGEARRRLERKEGRGPAPAGSLGDNGGNRQPSLCPGPVALGCPA